MEDDIAALRKEVEHLIAMHTASYVTLTSLVATHPQPCLLYTSPSPRD